VNAGPVLLAAGGTGGHVFPALAVAEELARRGVESVFVTDARGARWLPPGRPHRTVRAASPAGPLATRLSALVELAAGLREARRILATIRPRVAGLFGGYATVPVWLAARLRRLPLLLHEQNAVLGRVNRLAARGARLLALAFADTERVPAGVATVVTGNPVRPGFRTDGPRPRAGAGGPVLLVTGGSQGARVFGERVPGALARLPEGLRHRLVLWMQVRAEQVETVRARLADLVAAAEIRPFFEDLDRRLAAADLVLARAGASTLAELAAAGVPAVLVPYPHAADDHQRANARRVAAAGAAVSVDQEEATPERLAAVLGDLLLDEGRRAAMRQAMAALARPDAARHIADHLLRLAREGAP